MPDHHFNPDLAQKYGVDVAIFLHNIYFWIGRNRAYQKHFYKDRYWTYNSLAAFCTAHPYWSRRQIERIVSACKKSGLLLTDCFNQDRRDRTTWYTLSDQALKYFIDSTPKTEGCISPDGEMHGTDSGQSFHGAGTPLPDRNPVPSQTDIPPYSPPEGDAPAKRRRHRGPKAAPDWKPERFEGFWRLYPVKKSKQAAIRAWDLLRPDDDLLAVMGRGLTRQLAGEDWKRGFGIPYPATWLNNRRWEDEDKPSPPDPEEVVQDGWY